MVMMAHHLEAVMSTSTIERGQLAGLYSPPRTPVIVDVPTLVYLVVDGRGDPATSLAWAEAVDALTAVSAAVRTVLDVAAGPGMPLEILWPSDDGDDGWTLLMTQPHAATPDVVRRAIDLTRTTAGLVAASDVRRRRVHEGWAAQVMVVGPRGDAGDVRERLAAFTQRNGYRRHGLRHEIWLDDPATTAPTALRTIHRQPVAALA
jgi:hypothetical protein